jgi:hypothetical protein
MSAVCRDRLSLYSSAPVLDDINSVENGIFLRCDLHLSFAYADVAFLKVCGTVRKDSDIVNIRRFLDPKLCFGSC